MIRFLALLLWLALGVALLPIMGLVFLVEPLFGGMLFLCVGLLWFMVAFSLVGGAR